MNGLKIGDIVEIHSQRCGLKYCFAKITKIDTKSYDAVLVKTKLVDSGNGFAEYTSDEETDWSLKLMHNGKIRIPSETIDKLIDVKKVYINKQINDKWKPWNKENVVVYSVNPIFTGTHNDAPHLTW
jgi:hypothetical protein